MPLSCLCAPESLRSFDRPALVAGHPGHELKVFGWMFEYRPRLYLITDGGGRHGVSRVPASAALADRLGIQRGKTFGAVSDSRIYRAILERDFSLFLNLVEELSSSFVEHSVNLVAGDAAEGFNPTHDLCRAIIDGAVLMAERATGRTIANYEFCLAEWEHGFTEKHDSGCAHFRLDKRLLDQKLQAAENYAELRDEVQRAVARRGKDYFRIECLRKVVQPFQQRQLSGKPFYETWGEQRVAEGEYQSVIRFQEHVLPIIDALMGHASLAAAGTASALALTS